MQNILKSKHDQRFNIDEVSESHYQRELASGSNVVRIGRMIFTESWVCDSHELGISFLLPLKDIVRAHSDMSINRRRNNLQVFNFSVRLHFTENRGHLLRFGENQELAAQALELLAERCPNAQFGHADASLASALPLRHEEIVEQQRAARRNPAIVCAVGVVIALCFAALVLFDAVDLFGAILGGSLIVLGIGAILFWRRQMIAPEKFMAEYGVDEQAVNQFEQERNGDGETISVNGVMLTENWLLDAQGRRYKLLPLSALVWAYAYENNQLAWCFSNAETYVISCEIRQNLDDMLAFLQKHCPHMRFGETEENQQAWQQIKRQAKQKRR